MCDIAAVHIHDNAPEQHCSVIGMRGDVNDSMAGAPQTALWRGMLEGHYAEALWLDTTADGHFELHYIGPLCRGTANIQHTEPGRHTFDKHSM